MKRLRIILLIIFISSTYVNTFAQAPDTMWSKIYGGSEDDVGYWVEQTADGGFIITGYTRSYGGSDWDLWLLKTNSEGDTIWTKVYGNIGDDIGRCVQQTSDSGYIITGTYGPLSGGGLTDLWLLKTDSLGDTLWTKVFTGILEEEGYVVRETADMGYIITGETRSYPIDLGNVWILKTDLNGDTLWTKSYGEIGKRETGKDVLQTLDGGFVIISSGGWLIKTDSNGDSVWTKNFGGAYSILQNSDGGYVILSARTLQKTKVWLIKTNTNGDSLWTKEYGGDNYERGYSLAQTTDGGFIIAGKILGDVWLLKTNSSGDSLWSESLNFNSGDVGNCVKQTSDDGYIVAGFTNTALTKDDILLVKLEPDSPNLVIDFDDLVPSKYSLQQNYPDPFNPSTKIRYSVPYSSKVVIKVFDVLGNEIETLVNEEKPAGTYELTWYAEGLPSGVYFYQLRVTHPESGLPTGQAGTGQGFVGTKKMILLK